MRLNRHISILLTILILASNVGLAFNVHYCGDKVSSISLAYKVEEPCNDHHKKKSHKHDTRQKACCASTTDKHESCCKNDFVKLEDKSEGKVIVKSLQLDLGTFCEINEWKPAQFYTLAPVVITENPSFYCESHAPPLFKLYCRYILYA